MQFDRYRLILAATIGLGLAGTAIAQEATAPETPATEAPASAPDTETAPPAIGEAAAPLADGNPAATEMTEVVRDTFGDWQVRCTPQGNECFMYQLAVDAEENPVAEVSLLKLPTPSEAAAGVTVVSPLGTLLTSGVVVQIDTNEARQYPFNWCSQVGCFARFGLTDQSINAMKRGKAGKMTLISVGAPENPIALNLSLTGFTAAYDSLEIPTAPTAPAAAPTLAPAPAE